MKINPLFLLLLWFAFFMGSLPMQELSAQGRPASFRVDGPCLNCGAEKLTDFVSGFSGVTNVSFEPATKMVSLNYDPVEVSLIDLMLELSMAGYDAGDFRAAKRGLDPCCSEQVKVRGEAEEAEEDEVVGLDEVGPDEFFEEDEEDLFDLEGELEMLEEEELESELDEDFEALEEDFEDELEEDEDLLLLEDIPADSVPEPENDSVPEEDPDPEIDPEIDPDAEGGSALLPAQNRLSAPAHP